MGEQVEFSPGKGWHLHNLPTDPKFRRVYLQTLVDARVHVVVAGPPERHYEGWLELMDRDESRFGVVDRERDTGVETEHHSHTLLISSIAKLYVSTRLYNRGVERMIESEPVNFQI